MSQKDSELSQLPISGALTGMAIGLCTIISSTRCFGNERIVFWRESANGAYHTMYTIHDNCTINVRSTYGIRSAHHVVGASVLSGTYSTGPAKRPCTILYCVYQPWG